MDQFPIYSTASLLGVMRELEPVPSFWRDLFFRESITFEDEYVEFSKIENRRILAPFVLPTSEGKPIYGASERVDRFKPAYIKPKDKVDPTKLTVRQAGLGELGHQPALTPKARWDGTVANITREHREAIERRWEWMAAEAVLNGSVTVTGEGYPTQVVDFGRDANHTVVKTGTNYWGDAGISIIDDLNAWRERVRRAKHSGGAPNRIIMGSDAYDAFRKDDEIKDQLDTNFARTTQARINTGLRQEADIEMVGRLSESMEIWVYSDYYEQQDGTVVPFMDSRDILMVSPGFRGVACFGATLDKRANLAALPIFPKMWDEEDPSGTWIMTQSAPLYVPATPNGTLRARVVE